MSSVSEIMREKWKDPAFRKKCLDSQKKFTDEKMKRRLLELANGGGVE